MVISYLVVGGNALPGYSTNGNSGDQNTYQGRFTGQLNEHLQTLIFMLL